MQTTAIIGGGFSGTLTALNILFRDEGDPGRVVLIDGSGRFGPGVAYSTRAMVHYLNVPAGNMSAWDRDPQHFLRWINGRNPAVGSGSFVSRAWYGDYLREQIDEAARNFPARLELRAARITQLHRAQTSHWVLTDDSGVQTLADRVVLAPGNFPQPHPPGMPDDLIDHPGYIADPWRNDVINSILPDEPILCIGTGLTMMDVVMQLHAREHSGRMTAISRRGMLSRPHRSPSRPPTGKPPPELKDWDGSVKQLFRLIRETIRSRAAQGGDWRDVIASLRPITASLWQRLDDRERRRFLERLRAHWDVIRHRAAPETAAAIADLLAARQLSVRAGRIVSVRGHERQLEVTFRPRRSDNLQSIRVARVINCLGPESDVTRLRDPLIRQMLADGLITPDPHGLGIRTSPLGEVIHRDGTPDPSLLTVGSLRRGELWESTAVPELRRQAADIASLCVFHPTPQITTGLRGAAPTLPTSAPPTSPS